MHEANMKHIQYRPTPAVIKPVLRVHDICSKFASKVALSVLYVCFLV